MPQQKHLDPVCGMTVEESPNALTFDYKEAHVLLLWSRLP